ncbi:hypothetical protein PILCRDRAFT_85648 [Piloderma croceum F 1598]|uniref:HAT C-terminal dimerisation domain-containing protein n=1 Tax=Piloderma croceum (strain F 1598) TaxID=765440 RepID=A0A0C3G7P9_PILCF|nr:hypothetical protein PILCRDRAFT_85648 [Piloderma croceum F 1598]
MGLQERDLAKRAKIDYLRLTSDKWTHVGQFADLLSVLCHVAQQAFSSDAGTTLHLAIPALETLHQAWSSRAERSKYARFAPALTAAAKKLDEYYEKTTDSPAYIMAMLLDPTGKMAYFKKHWPENLQDEVLACAEGVVKPPAGMTTVQWWGINAQRYGPVWTSIAQDYLSIMAASVSSEQTFSQGGITISKCRNRLKGDIVEALQCVKCALHHDLLFREPGPSSSVEEEPDEYNIETVPNEKPSDDDDSESDFVMED